MNSFPETSLLDGKYRVIRKLGEGGFGRVYLAQDVLLKNRLVAIKSLHLDDSRRNQFLLREMEFLSSLANPNVVAFYHHFSQDERLFLVMEYCSGGSLRDLLEREGPLHENRVLDWGRQLCGTLDEIHKKGIVHHDLKPENIMFNADGVLKIADFGIANTRGGTIYYMAPELFMPGQTVSPVDCRVDIYALAMTILELIAGTDPFPGVSDEEVMSIKVRADFIPEILPQWLREVLLKALHPQPELRFQKMQELKESLESRYVPYVFDRKRILASKTASNAEASLAKKKWSKALKYISQALYQDRGCLNALIVAGKTELALRRIDKAVLYFEEALRINPRANIQKELGSIYLEKGRYAEAISMLNDHLHRNSSDYEAYNILAKAFYLTGRYEAAADLIRTIMKDYKENRCFENNLLISELLLAKSERVLSESFGTKNPFVEFNRNVFTEIPASWDKEGNSTLKNKLLFQEFRFGETKKFQPNVLLVDNFAWQKLRFGQHIISFGRGSKNDILCHQRGASRRHCLLVNYPKDVWLYDLGSTRGTFCDGSQVHGSMFLEGRHEVVIDDQPFTVVTNENLLL